MPEVLHFKVEEALVREKSGFCEYESASYCTLSMDALRPELEIYKGSLSTQSEYLSIRLASFLPLALGVHLALLVVLEHQSPQMIHFLIVLLNSAFYLALGMIIYSRLERVAKKKNLIGQY